MSGLGHSGRRRRALVRVLARFALAAALGASWVSTAPAAAQELKITSPADGSFTNSVRPLFSGTTSEPGDELAELPFPVQVSVYSGPDATGPEVEHLETGQFPGRSWSVEATQALLPGLYTAVASQPPGGNSSPVSFTVDTTAPEPRVTQPALGALLGGASVEVSGLAGSGEGDLSAVTVVLYAGPTATVPLESLVLPVRHGVWAGALGGLAPGSYLLGVEQSDAAGNRGVGPTVSFSVAGASPAAGPKVAFQWFPAQPRVGELVSLVSGSTDAASPITSFAWGVGATAPMQPGASVLTQTFSKAGVYMVRLRVTDAAGRSSIATQAIRIRARTLTVMQPFPIVRIAGTETANGVRLSLLTVAAPTSSTVTVKVRGGGLRTIFQSRVARLGRRPSSSQLLAFPRFQRALPDGAVLEVRVMKAGQIGKYTRFAPRRGALPVRTDSCASPVGKPMRCPS